MKIYGISILLITGSLNGVLLTFQIASGMRYIKVPFGLHKKTGIALVFTALIHAILAVLAH